MSKPFWENHPNENEFFPLRGNLGSPGEGASAAKLLGDLLAAIAAMAVAAGLLFYFYIDCVPISIEDVWARIEAIVYNREMDQVIEWYLIPGEDPESIPIPEPEDRTPLKEDREDLLLTGLTPGTEYTLVFVSYDEKGNAEIVHTFTFRTLGSGELPPQDSDPEPDPPSSPGTDQQPPPEPPSDPEGSEPSTPTEPSGPANYGGTGNSGGPTDSAGSELKGPAVQPLQVQNYRAISYDEWGEMASSGSYDAVFTFELGDAAAQSIRLTGTVGGEAVDELIPVDDSRVTRSGSRLILNYPVSGSFTKADLQATLNYTLGTETTAGSLTSASFLYGPGYLPGEEAGDAAAANTITAGTVNDGWIPVTLNMQYLDGVVSEFYYLEVQPAFSIIEPEYRELAEGTDYRLTGSWQEGNNIVIQAEIKLDANWNYFVLDVFVEGIHYLQDGTDMGLPTYSWALGQINLTNETYTVGPLAMPGGSAYGMYCTGISLNTAAEESSVITGVVPGQIVTVSMHLGGTATGDGEVIIQPPPGEIVLRPSYTGSNVERVGKDQTYGILVLEFEMPRQNVTAQDIVFGDLQEVGEETTAQATATATVSAVNGAALSHSVGPISIDQAINGLRCIQATFHTASQPSSTVLTEVPAGEKVYLEILLQGVSLKNFNLSASFAPSANIQDLKILNRDKVSILDSDAYLYVSFTMPNCPVTAEDIGFRGFTATP